MVHDRSQLHLPALSPTPDQIYPCVVLWIPQLQGLYGGGKRLNLIMAQGETNIYTVRLGFPKADCISAALGLIPLSTPSLETYQAQTGNNYLQTADKPCVLRSQYRVQPASSILTADVQDRIAYRQPINLPTYPQLPSMHGA